VQVPYNTACRSDLNDAKRRSGQETARPYSVLPTVLSEIHPTASPPVPPSRGIVRAAAGGVLPCFSRVVSTPPVPDGIHVKDREYAIEANSRQRRRRTVAVP